MNCTPIIPHRHASHRPLPPYEMIIRRMYVVVEELQQVICVYRSVPIVSI